MSDKRPDACSSITLPSHLLSNGRKVRHSDEFLAGMAAGFVNITLLFPVNKLIFRQVAQGYKPFLAATQMREEGLRHLYRGILPPLMQRMFSGSIMFGSFSFYKSRCDHQLRNKSPFASLSIAACLTGTTEAILTPLERIQMLMQDRKYNRDYRNTLDAAFKMKSYGFAEYYRGISCVLIRNSLSNILFFGTREEMNKLLRKLTPNIDKKPNTDYQTTNGLSSNDNYQTANKSANDRWYDFLSGAILGSLISTVFYPLTVVRTRIQTRAPGTQFLPILTAFKVVYFERDKKFTRFFHGCSLNIVRQFFSWGITNCVEKEVIRFLLEF